MKLLLALLIVVLAVQAAEIRSSTRSNLNIGSVRPYDRLLQRSQIYQRPRPNSIQYQDFVYRGNYSTKISAVFANEVGQTQYARAWILRGGVGSNNVTVRIQSARGYGYNYQIAVWGR